jgi:ClpP class serine protease
VCISPLPASAGQPLPAQAPVPRPVLPESCGAGESRTAGAAGGGKGRLIFLSPFLDKLGIKMLVTHIGNYKAAFENFARSDMSPEFHEMLEYLVESSYQAVQEIIAAGRGIPRARVAEAIDRAFLSAADLKALGLIDTIVPRDLFWAGVKADLGVDTLKLVTN